MRIQTIRKRADFLSASAKGKSFVTNSFILQMLQRNDLHPAGQTDVRFGLTVTKKMGNAVIRNRIKRRLREAIRKLPETLFQAGHDYVLISRHKAIDCTLQDLIRDMEFAFSKIPTMKGTSNRKPKA